MYKFFRKYQKQTLAFFMVILMVAFIVPTTFRGTQGAEDQIIGRIGDEKVTREQLRDAEDQVNMLTQVMLHVHPNGEQQWEPLLLSMPQAFIADIRNKPEKYYLLVVEAKKMGLAPDLKNAEGLLTTPNVGIRMPDESVVSFDNIADEGMRNNLEYSLANVLMISQAYRNATDALKISQPFVQHELAAESEKIKVRLVDFSGKDYLPRVPAPTADQLQQQFDRYSDIEPNLQPNVVDALGFGYKYPNRVKLQYLSVPRSEVRKAVQASRDDYAWEVEANRYYLKHQDEFPTTQPAAHAEPFSFAKPAATQPTTQPFAQVRQQIINDLLEPQTDKMQREIASELSSRLELDYNAYVKDPKSVTPDYEAFDYLKNLAQEIQSKYHVTITVASIADSFKTAADLRLLPGIGQINQFPDFVTNYIDPFAPAELRSNPNVLHLFQPSKPQPASSTPTGGDIYIFRVTAADPAHKPASLAEVKDQVETDWKHQQAYDLAKADAQKTYDAVQKLGLTPAAAGNHEIITTNSFGMSASAPIEHYDKLSTRAQYTFVRDTYALLGRLSDSSVKPVALIEMPTDWRLAVVELIAVESQLKPDQLAMAQSHATQNILEEYEQGMQNDWFNYNSIVQRLNYQDETTHHAVQ
jgi:hypothetical protein